MDMNGKTGDFEFAAEFVAGLSQQVLSTLCLAACSM
jgi:hypothetical protein